MPSPSERSFLEGYVEAARAGLIVDELSHDSRGHWSAELVDASTIRVRHHGAWVASLHLENDVVVSVRWEDARAPSMEADKAKHIARVVRSVAGMFETSLLGAAIGRASIAAQSTYQPDIDVWAVRAVLARIFEDAGDARRAHGLRGIDLGRSGGRRPAKEVTRIFEGVTDPALRTAGADTAHFFGIDRLYPAFPQRLLGHLSDPPWAGFALVACMLRANGSTDDAALYTLTDGNHGVVWLEGRALCFSEGALRSCFAAIPEPQRQRLLSVLPPLRGKRASRISVPAAPQLEPAPRLGSHAVVGDELWLSSPQGVAVRALPHLGRVRELPLSHRADAIAVSPDGQLLAAYGDWHSRRTLTIHDARTGEFRSEIDGNRSSGPRGLAFSPRGTLLSLTSATSSTIWRIDAAGHAETQSSISLGGLCAFTADEQVVLCGSESRVTRVRLAPRESEPVCDTGWFVSALTCSSDGAFYAAAFRKNREAPCRIVRIDSASGKLLVLHEQRFDLRGLAFSRAGELAAVDAYGTLLLFDRDGRLRRQAVASGGSATWTQSGHVVTGWARPSVTHAESGLVVATYGEAWAGSAAPERLAFAGDVLLSTNSTIGPRVPRSWDLASGLGLGAPPSIERHFVDPAWCPDGRSRVVASETGMTIGVMGDREPVCAGVDLERDGKIVRRLCLHTDTVIYLAVSRDGAFVLSVGGGEVRISSLDGARSARIAPDLDIDKARLDAEHRGVALVGKRAEDAPEARLVTLEGAVLARAAGPAEAVVGHFGARLLAVARPGGRIDILRGEGEVVTYDFHRAGVKELAISACSRYVASADFDGVVCVREIGGAA